MGASTVRRPARPGRHRLVLVILAVPALAARPRPRDRRVDATGARPPCKRCAPPWRRGRRHAPIHRATDRWRRSWRLLAWSSAVWLVGALVAIATDGIVTDDTFPTVLDGARIVALVIAIVALTTVPDRHDRWRRALLGLDGLVLAASLLYVGWTLHTGTALRRRRPGGRRSCRPAHPPRRRRRRLRLRRRTAGAGPTTRPASRRRSSRWPSSRRRSPMSSSSTVASVGASSLGSPSDLGWAAALVLVAAAALNASAEPTRVTDRVSDRIIMGASLVALVPLVVIFFISVVRTPLEGAPHTVEWLLLASAVVLCVVARFDRPCATTSPSPRTSPRTSPPAVTSSAAAVHLQRLTLNAVHEGIVGLREGQLVFANDAAGEILARATRRADRALRVRGASRSAPPTTRSWPRSTPPITARQHVELVGEPVVRMRRHDVRHRPVDHPGRPPRPDVGRRVPRRVAPHRGRAAEERVRVGGQPRAAHAADLDPGLARPARRRRRRRAVAARPAHGGDRHREHGAA